MFRDCVQTKEFRSFPRINWGKEGILLIAHVDDKTSRILIMMVARIVKAFQNFPHLLELVDIFWE